MFEPRKKAASLTLIVWICLIGTQVAAGDVVTDWNRYAVAAQIASGAPRPGGTGMLDFAKVHAAMHDAIQAIEQRYELYGPAIPDASGSPIAAAATAAHDVLAVIFPNQAATLDTTLTTYLSGLGLLGDPGMAVGHQAALNILNKRATDGSFPNPPPPPEVGGTAVGEWRPTLPAFAPFAAPWLGAVTPYALNDSTQLEAPQGPPPLDSDKYAAEFNEVKSLGSRFNSTRTQAQTDLASFYRGSFILVIQATLRNVAEANIHNLSDSGRLFALANMAATDAVINVWATKKRWMFWRPITAIQEGENDGNPATAGDLNWVPLLDTPPYPEYSSGANSVIAALARTLSLLYGDKFEFTVTNPFGDNKTYARCSDLPTDVVNVRIYQGVHFRSADEVGRRQGTRAAEWTFTHVLRPL